MKSKIRLVIALCLFILAIVVLVLAWKKQQGPSLSEVDTINGIYAYMMHQESKIDPNESEKRKFLARADLYTKVHERVLEIAQNDEQELLAYQLQYGALNFLAKAEQEGAEQKMEAFIDEIAAKNKFEAFVKEIRFSQFASEMDKNPLDTAERLDSFRTQLKYWIDQHVSIGWMVRLISDLADKNRFPAEPVVRELMEYVQSDACPLSAEEKQEYTVFVEGFFRQQLGQNPKLYGRTLDNSEFDWESLRGKYVLIKFTATWCGPCKGEIPGMLNAYEQYHDKGLEIVSVYVWENEDDPVSAVRKVVEEEKLPWMILSEHLSEKAGMPKQSDSYVLSGVPTMLLTDKEGNIIMTDARGQNLQAKLAEIFAPL